MGTALVVGQVGQQGARLISREPGEVPVPPSHPQPSEHLYPPGFLQHGPRYAPFLVFLMSPASWLDLTALKFSRNNCEPTPVLLAAHVLLFIETPSNCDGPVSSRETRYRFFFCLIDRLKY